MSKIVIRIDFVSVLGNGVYIFSAHDPQGEICPEQKPFIVSMG